MTAGGHWLTATRVGIDVQDVLEALCSRWGESAIVRGGILGYGEGYQVGAAGVFAHADRPEMGVMVQFTGEGVEAVGMAEAVAVVLDLDMGVTRLDLALDHCPFTPAELQAAWIGGDVRTRCKVPKAAREDRQWRTCDWDQDPAGDVFRMGSRQSEQFARCYDRRGFTRFELELKGATAELAFRELAGLIVAGSDEFAPAALSWVRRFVDFVDAASSAHASRRTLLPFWAAFVGQAERAVVQVAATVVRTVEEAHEWVVRQVAPTLALLGAALGWDEVIRVAKDARGRLQRRHRVMLALHRRGVAAGVA